jgi:hypothetical protein
MDAKQYSHASANALMASGSCVLPDIDRLSGPSMAGTRTINALLEIDLESCIRISSLPVLDWFLQETQFDSPLVYHCICNSWACILLLTRDLSHASGYLENHTHTCQAAPAIL